MSSFVGLCVIFVVVAVVVVCLCTYVCSALRGKKRASDPQDLELQVFVSCQCGCWESGFKSSGRAADALAC